MQWRDLKGDRDGHEFDLLVREFGYGWPDLEWLTINALKSAFAPFDERIALIDRVVKPGFAELIRAAGIAGEAQVSR